MSGPHWKSQVLSLKDMKINIPLIVAFIAAMILFTVCYYGFWHFLVWLARMS